MDRIVRVTKRAAPTVVLALALLALSGCGGGDDTAAIAAASATTPSAATAATIAVGTTTAPAAPSTTPVTTSPVVTTAAAATTAADTPALTEPPAPTTTAPTSAAGPTASVGADGEVTIAVTVGTDDATTLGQRTETVPRGAPVRLRLLAPGAEEYHLHGYDVEQKAPAGQPVVISFTADQVGTFALESHRTEDVLLTLVVR